MRKIIFTLSVTMNLIVLALIVWISSGGALGFFVARFIEPAHERWVTQFEELSVKASDTVFLGDSITEGGAWHELFPTSRVRNRGIGGDVTAGVLRRLDQVTSGQPRQVFLLIGTNDLFAGVAESEIASNIARIIDKTKAASPDTNFFVQSVLPRGAEYRESVESLNAAIESVIVGKATWINLYPLFMDEADGSIRDEFSNDELHLLGAGYGAWRDAIRDLVSRGE